jgi:hypothetical protein
VEAATSSVEVAAAGERSVVSVVVLDSSIVIGVLELVSGTSAKLGLTGKSRKKNAVTIAIRRMEFCGMVIDWINVS